MSGRTSLLPPVRVLALRWLLAPLLVDAVAASLTHPALRQRAPQAAVTSLAPAADPAVTAVSDCHLHGTVQYVSRA